MTTSALLPPAHRPLPLAARLAAMVSAIPVAQTPSLVMTALAVETGWDLALLWTPTPDGRLRVLDPGYCADDALEAYHRASREQRADLGSLVHQTWVTGRTSLGDGRAAPQVDPRSAHLPGDWNLRALALPVVVAGRTVAVVEMVALACECTESSCGDHGLGAVPDADVRGDLVATALGTLGLTLHERTLSGGTTSVAPSGRRAPAVPTARTGWAAATERDSVTGAMTRRGLLDHSPRGTHHDLVLVDLDGFREVNEQHGMHGGDALLRQVAARLQVAAVAPTAVARVGADEFVLLTGALSGTAVAGRVSRAMEVPFAVNGKTATPRASIVVITDGWDVETSLADADALVHSPARRRAGVVRRCSVEPSTERARTRQGSDLRAALDHGQITALFQPVVDVRRGAVTGTEALLRWRHPVHGQVPPSVFVPLAEDLGLISALGRFALVQALAQQADWARHLGHDAPASVAVNVSAHQVGDPDFAEQVLADLTAAGLPASSLSLEITETAIVSEASRKVAIDNLTALAGAGIGVDIDDFGTGHSSFERLLHLPVTALKVDRLFVRGLVTDGPATSTVESLLALTQRLGLLSVAEGVERTHHLDWLREHDCDRAQGYLFAPPLPAAAVTDLIRSGRRW